MALRRFYPYHHSDTVRLAHRHYCHYCTTVLSSTRVLSTTVGLKHHPHHHHHHFRHSTKVLSKTDTNCSTGYSPSPAYKGLCVCNAEGVANSTIGDCDTTMLIAAYIQQLMRNQPLRQISRSVGSGLCGTDDQGRVKLDDDGAPSNPIKIGSGTTMRDQNGYKFNWYNSADADDDHDRGPMRTPPSQGW